MAKPRKILTADEIDYAVQNMGKKKQLDVAKHLGIPRHSIYRQLKALGKIEDRKLTGSSKRKKAKVIEGYFDDSEIKAAYAW
jgi:hypothetical protein